MQNFNIAEACLPDDFRAARIPQIREIVIQLFQQGIPNLWLRSQLRRNRVTMKLVYAALRPVGPLPGCPVELVVEGNRVEHLLLLDFWLFS